MNKVDEQIRRSESGISVQFMRGETTVTIKRAGQDMPEHFTGRFLSDCLVQLTTEQTEWIRAMAQLVSRSADGWSR